jgi:hypothetical protein
MRVRDKLTSLAAVASLAVVLASCAKQPEPDGKNEPVEEKGPQGDRKMTADSKKYVTVEEEKLKGVVRTRFDSPNPTKAQLERRARNIAIVRQMGLPVLETLPVLEDDATVKIRGAEEVAKRCLATTFCAVKGETNDAKFVESLISDYAASSYLSPAEQRFIRDENPAKQNLIDFAWRYECVHVFLWALCLRDELAAPHDLCPVGSDMKLIKAIDRADFVRKPKLRNPSEILDMADLYYRLHWAAIELRIKGKKSDKLDEGIIRERHYALNWLIRHLNAEWDDVSTDT